jgi:hypothetical protein
MRFFTVIVFILFQSIQTAAQTSDQLQNLARDTEKCLAGSMAACDLILPLFAPGESTHQMIVALKECYDPSASTPTACDKAISFLSSPTTQRMIDARQPLLKRRGALQAKLESAKDTEVACVGGSIADCNKLGGGSTAFDYIVAQLKKCWSNDNRDPIPCDTAAKGLRFSPSNSLAKAALDRLLNHRKALSTQELVRERGVDDLKRSTVSTRSFLSEMPSFDRAFSSLVSWLNSQWVVAAVLTALFMTAIAIVPHGSLTSEDFGTPLSKQIPIGTRDFTILLRIRRTQRFTLIMRRPKFILYFKADVSPDDMALINNYKLGKSHLYTSEEFKKRFEEMNKPVDTSLAALKQVLAFFTKWFTWIVLIFTLKITVRTIIRGTRVEKADLGDLMSLEQQVVSAANSLKGYLAVARTFNGAVETIEI